MHVLVLGGTTEARQLARLLAARERTVTSSLAGRVAAPTLPEGNVRIGGFGGVEGMARWLREHHVDAVVDATHPFAERISANAAEAATRTGVPLLALRRPGWTPVPGDDWRFADSLAQAAQLLPDLSDRVFLTTGRSGLAAFAGLDGLWFLVRSVDPPEGEVPRRMTVLLDRGPYTLQGEREVLREHRIGVLVTKDSGGAATAAKLVAAREAGLPVVVVRRPPGVAGVEVAQDVERAARWVRERVG
ncbi:cobalt-precorrin-6A reductase [Actinacidiphila sp. bgisy144]|uniref:cobalt-precorrin-6A reductase n=1 Tax=unclassified Actinacidiphila TaxID=2995708 RepID=UPI003EC0774B